MCRLTLAGAILATGCALLDLFGIYDFNFVSIAVVIALCSLAGSIYGLSIKAPVKLLAKSIDRRAGLQDRLSSAITASDSAFRDELLQDATSRLAAVSEKDVFPIRFARAQFGMVFSVVLPFAVLFVSLNHLLLNSKSREEREQVKAQAVTVQHVLNSLAKSPEEAEREADLVKKLQKLEHDLERGKLDRQEAKEKADQISQQADRMMREENQRTRQSLDNAQSALERVKAQDRLDKTTNGLDKSNQDLTGNGSEQKLKELASNPSPEKLSKIANQIAALQKKLTEGENLTQSQRNELQKELSELQKEEQQLQLSKEAQEALQRLQNDPEYQRLMKEMEKLRENADRMDRDGSQSLTKEQIQEMERQLEQLAKQLNSPKAIKEYIKSLEEAMKHAEEAGDMKSVATLMGMLGMPEGGAPSTSPGPPSGAPLNMSDKEAPGQGKTHEIAIEAEQKPNGQPSPYIEQRGMAKLTGPSSIPLLRDVAASRRKAEEAISKQRVPKEQQARVKKYFESLEGKS